MTRFYSCPKQSCMGELVWDHMEAAYSCNDCGFICSLEDLPGYRESESERMDTIFNRFFDYE